MSTPTFTSDWFTSKTPAWNDHVVPRLRDVQDARWIEVGSYEGRSALWTLDHVLTGPRSTITCVDVFSLNLPGIEYWGNKDYPLLFDANTRGRANLIAVRGRSADVLPLLARRSFHGAYLDGDHGEGSVTQDLRLTWDLLLPGAVLACDDYGSVQHPGTRRAIDKFFSDPEIPHQVLFKDFQIIVLKR